jgi:glycerophosphoryl diester phosphodiesterase
MASSRPFDLQGHRGARGLKPENTLPSFEAAFDVGVTSVETDVHLTRDGIPVLLHDAHVGDRLFRLLPGSDSPAPELRPAVSTLTLAQLCGYRVDRNPDTVRFPTQDATVTPAARLFAERQGFDPYTPLTLARLFAFTAAYAGEMGNEVGKTATQRERARRVRFDVELKRVPYRPAHVGDFFDGEHPGRMEESVVACVREWGVLGRTAVRSFDHRSVWTIRQLEPELARAVLVAETAPVSPAQVAREAGAQTYCPHVAFLDGALVRRTRAEGVRVLPWTVNDPVDWQRLLDWGVDGITTDFPDRLAIWLRERSIEF